jgi:hypothetical protein
MPMKKTVANRGINYRGFFKTFFCGFEEIILKNLRIFLLKDDLLSSIFDINSLIENNVVVVLSSMIESS